MMPHVEDDRHIPVVVNGYRRNVAIVLCNRSDQVFWARRVRHDGWQFPQGGVRAEETSEEALFRELNEEVGLSPGDVQIVGRTREWLRYDLPEDLRRRLGGRAIRGQEQRWYLLRMMCDEQAICLDASPRPEFDSWCWVDYWRPVGEIVDFKRAVYRRALQELAPLLFAA